MASNLMEPIDDLMLKLSSPDPLVAYLATKKMQERIKTGALEEWEEESICSRLWSTATNLGYKVSARHESCSGEGPRKGQELEDTLAHASSQTDGAQPHLSRAEGSLRAHPEGHNFGIAAAHAFGCLRSCLKQSQSREPRVSSPDSSEGSHGEEDGEDMRATRFLRHLWSHVMTLDWKEYLKGLAHAIHGGHNGQVAGFLGSSKWRESHGFSFANRPTERESFDEAKAARSATCAEAPLPYKRRRLMTVSSIAETKQGGSQDLTKPRPVLSRGEAEVILSSAFRLISALLKVGSESLGRYRSMPDHDGNGDIVAKGLEAVSETAESCCGELLDAFTRPHNHSYGEQCLSGYLQHKLMAIMLLLAFRWEQQPDRALPLIDSIHGHQSYLFGPSSSLFDSSGGDLSASPFVASFVASNLTRNKTEAPIQMSHRLWQKAVSTTECLLLFPEMNENPNLSLVPVGPNIQRRVLLLLLRIASCRGQNPGRGVVSASDQLPQPPQLQPEHSAEGVRAYAASTLLAGLKSLLDLENVSDGLERPAGEARQAEETCADDGEHRGSEVMQEREIARGGEGGRAREEWVMRVAETEECGGAMGREAVAWRLLQLLQDEDDVMLEVLLELLSFTPNISSREFLSEQQLESVASMELSPTWAANLADALHPIRLFHAFLATLAYDQSVLLDFLISSDTATVCLRYLLRVLASAADSWPAFVELAPSAVASARTPPHQASAMETAVPQQPERRAGASQCHGRASISTRAAGSCADNAGRDLEDHVESRSLQTMSRLEQQVHSPCGAGCPPAQSRGVASASPSPEPFLQHCPSRSVSNPSSTQSDSHGEDRGSPKIGVNMGNTDVQLEVENREVQSTIRKKTNEKVEIIREDSPMEAGEPSGWGVEAKRHAREREAQDASSQKPPRSNKLLYRESAFHEEAAERGEEGRSEPCRVDAGRGDEVHQPLASQKQEADKGAGLATASSAEKVRRKAAAEPKESEGHWTARVVIPGQRHGGRSSWSEECEAGLLGHGANDAGGKSQEAAKKAMACLGGLRGSMERLHLRGLFPYNPTPLLRRLVVVETHWQQHLDPRVNIH